MRQVWDILAAMATDMGSPPPQDPWCTEDISVLEEAVRTRERHPKEAPQEGAPSTF